MGLLSAPRPLWPRAGEVALVGPCFGIPQFSYVAGRVGFDEEAGIGRRSGAVGAQVGFVPCGRPRRGSVGRISTGAVGGLAVHGEGGGGLTFRGEELFGRWRWGVAGFHVLTGGDDEEAHADEEAENQEQGENGFHRAVSTIR